MSSRRVLLLRIQSSPTTETTISNSSNRVYPRKSRAARRSGEVSHHQAMGSGTRKTHPDSNVALTETSGVTELRSASRRKFEEAKNDDEYIAGKHNIHAGQFEEGSLSREVRKNVHQLQGTI